MSQFISAMFDYDGTITAKRGSKTIELELKKLLIELTQKYTFAICSGRRFKFLKPVIDDLCSNSKDSELTRRNWYLVCENGASGHYYDQKKGCYIEHYHKPWPYGDKHKASFYSELIKRFSDKIESCENNRSVIVLRPHGYTEITSIDLAQKSQELLQLVIPTIEEFDDANTLYAFNSSIAVIIINLNADKDIGVSHFAEFLKTKHGLDLGKGAKKILCIGDSAASGGNDEAFLSGKYGTPFTVGDINKQNPQLQIATDKDGTFLKAAKGTKHLLEKFF